MPPTDWEQIRVQVPAAWKAELQEAAKAQAVPVGTLCRLVLRDFLRGRYSEEERKALEAKQ